MKVCLGIDTSNYRTSTALCALKSGAKDSLFYEERRLLTVEMGQRGLQQSQALFQHIARLPELMEKLLSAHPECEVAAVCVSTRPRPAEDSYMPVFRAGECAARTAAAALHAPCFFTSHQEGHLAAARIGTSLDAEKPYLALHLSGGTTEVLAVSPGRYELLGGSKDLHAGQLIDRVGVKLGLPFPAGPELEKLAAKGCAQARLSASLHGLECHFSGAETKALKWIESGELSPEDVAAETFGCVARTVARLVLAGCEKANATQALLAGGVASSALLRGEIIERVSKRNAEIRLHFARPELSVDNAVGVALIGAEKFGGGAVGQAD